MTAPCPAYPWCTRAGTHARLHTAVVTAPAPGAPSAQQVELARSGAGQATHIVLSTVRRGSTTVRRGQTALLTPTAARASARAAQRAGDSTLAAALVQAADLAESGGAR